ncbi:M14 family metallopeptidase [Pontimicrobium sp. IMCC45349]|uniref:M14 family metallopeptidase n=1 Tax=Pontimicrobium sp. IMCC45349 TaxID=3391574 RepID=UPI0039A3A3CE
MRKFIFISMLLVFFACGNTETKTTYDFTTTFETSKGTQTATYHEVIAFWEALTKAYPEINIQTVGETDSGYPLHLVTLNPNGNFNFENIRENKRILLINNGIHPGESDGIDATMLLFRDIVQGKIDMPQQTVLTTIPIYNIGGSLNRNSGTRANQNGPESYGFRGNAQNYDLNRDFIKSDTKNARAFAELFHLVKPDVFIDNHVSNGADYQYTLTHLFTQHNKLGDKLGNYIHTEMQPKLEEKLAAKNWDITPYVNVFGRTPDEGFSQFMDYPRYSTGYTTLFNTLGMMVETHMLKPYKPRVEGTYELMKSMIEITEEDAERIKDLRQDMAFLIRKQKNYPLDWKIDTTQTSTLNFKGYESAYIESEVTGAKRLKYDRSKPFTKDVSYQNYFTPTIEVDIPSVYIIPQGWHKVIDLLKLNQIEMKALENDSTITVESYKIAGYKTRTSAYEGHYPHYNTTVTSSTQTLTFRKGDIIINTAQEGFRYLIETLEPQAPDSFFNWNFFDTILQQKEYFSPYVFEDTAKQLLDSDPKLKAAFETKKETDDSFKNNWYAQLSWLYQHSNHYEKAHMQYPVYRIK